MLTFFVGIKNRKLFQLPLTNTIGCNVVVWLSDNVVGHITEVVFELLGLISVFHYAVFLFCSFRHMGRVS